MIVRKLVLVGAAASLATAATAAEEKANWGMGARVRVDAVQSNTSTTAGSAAKTTSKSSKINLNRAEFTLTGKRANDELKVRYWAESNTLWTATITHKWSDMISTSFGKIAPNLQSWENDYDITDNYIFSAANAYVPSSNTPGVEVDLAFGDHKIALQALQGMRSLTLTGSPLMTSSTPVNLTFNDGGSISSSIQYRGEFMKMIRPLLSYGVINTSGYQGMANGTQVNFANPYQTNIGVGVQVEASGATIDAEYDSVKIAKFKDNSSAANTDTNVSSLVLQAKYAIGATTPFVKITSDSTKTGLPQSAIDASSTAIGDTTGMQYAIGAEHKVDATCRLHALYFGQNTKQNMAQSQSQKVATSGFNFGVTASM